VPAFAEHLKVQVRKWIKPGVLSAYRRQWRIVALAEELLKRSPPSEKPVAP
jgi:hypothetical protein